MWPLIITLRPHETRPARSLPNTAANVFTVESISLTLERTGLMFASRATPIQGFRMAKKNRVDPFLEGKLRPRLIEAAKDLQSILEKYDKASGQDNAPQLKAQLARFIKKNRS